MQRRAFLLGAPLVVAGCAGGDSVWAPDSAVDAAMFLGTGPKGVDPIYHAQYRIW